MRLTVKTINSELQQRGYGARLARGKGYFYFCLGEAAGWLNRTVKVPKVDSLTLNEWLAEYERLKKLNQGIMRDGKKRTQKTNA